MLLVLGFVGVFIIGMVAGAALALEAYRDQVRKKVEEAKAVTQEARQILQAQTMAEVIRMRHRD